VKRLDLAALLMAADAPERARLLRRHRALADVELARALKASYDAAESRAPAQAANAAAALAELSQHTGDPETAALAAWTGGLVALDRGQLDVTITSLAEAEARFMAIGQRHTAAATSVGKLIALAIQGRYDEAIGCGLAARDVFVAHGDMLAAGKIEQNLGNIYARREQYHEAEQLYLAAHDRFAAAGDTKELARVNNNLGNVLALQNAFRAAAARYDQALAHAEAAGLAVTQAEIECNLGCCALDQGHYDQALDYLERSRRRYLALAMPHRAARAELELADTYLALNLAPEAAAIYARVAATFAELGMRAEQARALADRGRACLELGQHDTARKLLAEARALYVAEGNAVGAAGVLLAEAQLEHRSGDYATAAAHAAAAAAPLAEARLWGRLLLARWQRAEAERAQGRHEQARTLLQGVLRDAERLVVPQVAQRCHTSLGLLAVAAGDTPRAEAAFRRAAALIEDLRAPLPTDEYRAGFVADKLTPYGELARLALADAGNARVAEALGFVELARSRALADLVGDTPPTRPGPHEPIGRGLAARIAELREDLSWMYRQIYRPREGASVRSPDATVELHTALREREAELSELLRRLGQDAPALATARPESLDLAQLQNALGADTALVEYWSIDGELLAFVVTDAGVAVARGLGHEDEAAAALAQLNFQIGALRQGTTELNPFLDELAARTRHHLGRLYDLLLRPIEPYLADRRLAIVPHRVLHYVPFHALHDGSHYVIERREVCYAPSASVLRHCLARPRQPLESAVLLGFPDAGMPRARDEVAALGRLFPKATILLDAEATLAALRRHAPSADALHLACHSQFRADNPLFSALQLAGGWLTVNDAYGLDLHCQLVALSGCETGVSEIAPGDEIVGLARGFFAAGAPTLLVSLWAVDDSTTATLMACFYTRLRAGDRPAAALRHAQRELLARHPHPFFWSPFVLFGRW
jgi:tetratricopeptide (TPR) repeat protein